MLLIEIVDEARAILNEPLSATRTFPDDTSSFWTDTILATYVNHAQADVQNALIQTFEDYFVTQTTINIVAGTRAYSLPSGFIKMRRVEDLAGGASDPPEIPPTTMNAREQIYGNIAASATHQFGGYFLRGNQIVFDSDPGNTLASGVRLYYVKQFTTIASGTSTPEIPAEYHRLLVWKCADLALKQQQSANNFAEKEYQRLLENMVKQAENRQVQRSRSVNRTRNMRVRGI